MFCFLPQYSVNRGQVKTTLSINFKPLRTQLKNLIKKPHFTKDLPEIEVALSHPLAKKSDAKLLRVMDSAIWDEIAKDLPRCRGRLGLGMGNTFLHLDISGARV